MKKTLMAVALTLVAAAANAENTPVEFTIRSGESNTKITTPVGRPAPYSQMSELKSSCSFKSGYVNSTIEFNASTGVSVAILPLERTASGVKTLVTINKVSAAEQEWVVVSEGCKVPIGSVSSAGITSVNTFQWGEPAKLKLSDGSIVSITATR